MSKKIDKSKIWYIDARDQALKLAESQENFTVPDVFDKVKWRIGWIGMPAKKVMVYVDAAVRDLTKAREIELMTEYPGLPRGLVYRRCGVLDRIVGALEADER